MKGQLLKITGQQSLCAFSVKSKIRGWNGNPEICLERPCWPLQPVTATDIPELSHTPHGKELHLTWCYRAAFLLA